MNMQTKFKYVYGPVYSWRLGHSVGIDPIATQSKICNLDCNYCQLGRTAKFKIERENFVPVDDLINEILDFPRVKIDHYTFSGRGEPTLAKNLGEMVQAIRKVKDKKIAIITDSVLINNQDTRGDLALFDIVLAKLDAFDQDSFEKVDFPPEGVKFLDILKGLQKFKQEYKGRLALQIMFVEQNKDYAGEIAECARLINADEIQINTPLRPSGTRPLSEEDLLRIKDSFQGLPAMTVYEAERKKIQPINDRDTILRHGNFK